MNLTLFQRRRHGGSSFTPEYREDGNTLRLIDAPQPVSSGRAWEPRIVRSDELATEAGEFGGVTARAEVRAKRFLGNTVSDDRYEATITAMNGSPSALMSALSRMISEVDELGASRGPEERVILQVSVIL